MNCPYCEGEGYTTADGPQPFKFICNFCNGEGEIYKSDPLVKFWDSIFERIAKLLTRKNKKKGVDIYI